jgi:Ala-tRNA(Pro) deacylase
MAISSTLKAFLTKHKVKYRSQKHPVVYTAQEIAAAQHVPGKQLVKCVLVKTDKGFRLAVLPAIHLVDLAKLKRLLKVKRLTLASEADIKQAFPDVEVGAMSPFGNLYNVPTIVDKTLMESSEIVCNAGTHTETIKLRFQDFVKHAKPRVGLFGLHVAASRRAKKRKRA